MPQSAHDRAAELHGLAEHTHAAAVVSHDKADHLTSHELSKVADERSTTKGKHDDEVAAESQSRTRRRVGKFNRAILCCARSAITVYQAVRRHF